MKRSFLALLATFAAVSAQAGSFGGPPPFSNGSPLVTGVDGSYQASARAQNVSGIIRFQYSGGVQTSTTSRNSWIFFVNGQVQRGSTVANINKGKIDGILDSLTAATTINSNGTVDLPTVFINADNSSSGFFKGKMSRNGDFNGSGELQPAPSSTNQVVGISQGFVAVSINPSNTFLVPRGIEVTNATYTNIAGSIPITPFKFRGVRATTTVTATSSSAN